MERAMSVEERIRRAEEVYNKRNGQYISPKKDKSKIKKTSSIKKMMMQIFVCLMIYLAFYVFTNSEYIFSQEFLNQVKGTFNEDSKIYGAYMNVKSFVQNIISKNHEDNQNETSNEEDNKDESIGGAEEKSIEEEQTENKKETKKEEKTENTSAKKQEKAQTQMEKDAQEVKKKISFIKPLSGKITSTFGWRTPTTKTVPKYHTGVDIATDTGTVIKSATDGEVILASSEGDYGKHYKIKIDDVVIIYAHCSKLYLKEGDKVKQGDKIAEVGSTGNSTGPHLHFEIRKDERLVDPQLILKI